MNRWTPLGIALLAGFLLPRPSRGEEAVTVTVCDLMSNPGAYDHKLIRVQGWVLRGFEDFSLSGPGCEGKNMIWLEFGGTQGSEVTYCCGATNQRARPEPLVVEGIETSLVRDKALAKFDALTRRREGYGHAKATILGRYFAGEKQDFPGGTFWVGYGHMNMATLLVIQQILAVEKE
jgi:hypothetical protein